MLLRQKQNLEQDLIIIKVKVHTCDLEKNLSIAEQCFQFHEHYGQHSHDGIDDW